MRQLIVTKLMQRYWRMTRALTIGAQGVVLNGDGRDAQVLLVRHTYRPGWHFPGGGVERNETVMSALTRELAEEAAVRLIGVPSLFGIYANFQMFPSDHIALFVVRDWEQPAPHVPDREIAECRLFPVSQLPIDVRPSVARRLDEILTGRPISTDW